MKETLKKYGLSNAIYFIYCLFIWTVIGGVLWMLEDDKSIYIAINNNHSEIADRILPFITYTGTFPFIFICLILLFLIPAFRKISFLITMVICQLVPLILVQIIKNIAQSPRPLRYFDSADWINFLEGQPLNYSMSFPSGHTEGVFALCCFLAICLIKRFRFLGLFLFLFALLSGFSRIYLSQHFFADVYVGSLIGGFGVLLCYAFTSRFRKTKEVVQPDLEVLNE